MKLQGLICLLFWLISYSATYGQNQLNLFKSNIGTLDPSASFFGKETVERIGYALAGAGDVNGDGFDDFLIGTFHNDVRGLDAGAAYLFLGHAYLKWGLNDSVLSADARFLGQKAYDAAGYSVACNGDLNGDGFDDMLIGAPAGNDRVPWMSGRVYIIFGKEQADWGKEFLLYDSADAMYEGDGLQDLAGLSVAYIGDINNDGYDDFLVGAPYKDVKYEDAGMAYLILGRSNNWLQLDYLTNADASFKYEMEGSNVGYSVAGIGDVNNDGIPDFAIGAIGRSHIFVIYGRTNVSWGKNFDLANADLILYGTYRYTNEGVGWKVAGGGDLNGDGISDLIVSAIYDSEKEFQAGKVYVLFGRTGGWETQEIALKDGDASFAGEQTTDHAGWGLAMAGDVDDDGFDDFLIGTYKDDNGPVDGKAYLIKGKATGWQMNVPLITITDYCERDSSGIGHAVSTAGDFDNDGLDDYLIAAPFNSEIHKWNGKVFLFASQQVPYEVSGTVTYRRTQKPIPGTILFTDSIEAAIDSTDELGKYQLFVKGKQDHSIIIKKQMGEHVGSSITSYDAALIAQMAIGLDVPDFICQEAADVNFDNKINMYDAANTLRYAVKLPSLPDSRAGEWLFSPQTMFYDSIIADQMNQDYIGVVRGDVDLSWQYPDSSLPKSLTNRIICQTISRNEEYHLPISVTNYQSFISFDLDIRYDKKMLEFIGIEKTELIKDFKIEYNSDLKDRLLLAGYTFKNVQREGVLLNLVFKPIKNGDNQTDIITNKFLLDKHSVELATINLKIEDEFQLPENFQLMQNYPNPFNHSTIIPFSVPKSGHVKIIIYNTLGKQIKTLMSQNVLPGTYRIAWDGKDEFDNAVVSGVYICKMSHPTGKANIKIIHIK